jgi:hypothetical protein
MESKICEKKGIKILVMNMLLEKKLTKLYAHFVI